MTADEKDFSKLGTLEKAKKYQHIHHVMYFAGLLLTGVLLAICALTPFGGVLRNAAGSWTNPWFELQLYFLLFSLVFFIFDLPLEYYGGFVVEKQFDLTNHTLGTWALDELKKAVLSFMIASFLIQLIYWLIRISPQNWWWMAWLSYFLLTLFFTKIVPLWIIPLFYKYGPIDNPALIDSIRQLGLENGLKIQNFFSLNLSRTTKKANAMFTGLGRTKRVVLGDTLLKNFSNDEIEVVLAHEIGHFKMRHILKSILLGAVFSFGLFYLSFIFLRQLSQSHSLSASDPFFFPQLAFLLWAISIALDPFFKWISRRNECQADRFALQATRKKEAFISAFKKLAEQNLADPEPNPWIERLIYTHPSIAKRIRFAENYKA